MNRQVGSVPFLMLILSRIAYLVSKETHAQGEVAFSTGDRLAILQQDEV